MKVTQNERGCGNLQSESLTEDAGVTHFKTNLCYFTLCSCLLIIYLLYFLHHPFPVSTNMNIGVSVFTSLFFCFFFNLCSFSSIPLSMITLVVQYAVSVQAVLQLLFKVNRWQRLVVLYWTVFFQKKEGRGTTNMSTHLCYTCVF